MENPTSSQPNGGHSASMRTGAKWMIAGATLLGLGFFGSVFCFHSNISMNIPLYGMTSTGLVVLIYGFYKAFG